MSQDRWIETALQEQPLAYAVQPIRGFKDGDWRPVRLEWLIRPERHWNLRTCEFVDGIMSIGRESDLDRRVIRDAIHFLAEHPDQVLAVNIFGTSCCDPEFPRFVSDELAAHGVNPRSLHLEITEHEPLRDLIDATEIIREVRNNGVCIGLDDVGAGFHTVPTALQLGMVDYIKLDRYLLREDDDRAARRLHALVGYAQDLGLEAVAEGIENENQARHALELGVTLAQGFLWDLPKPAYLSEPLARRSKNLRTAVA